MKSGLQILKEARALLAAGHWHQGEFTNTNMTCFCAVGAISFCSLEDPTTLGDALSDDEDFFDNQLNAPGTATAIDALRVTLSGWSVTEWNDRSDTTLDQVLTVFNTTIERLEQ